MKPVYVKPNIYIDFGIRNNEKEPIFNVGNQVRISKYKNAFEKGYAPNCDEEAFVFKKVENAVPWTYETYAIEHGSMV